MLEKNTEAVGQKRPVKAYTTVVGSFIYMLVSHSVYNLTLIVCRVILLGFLPRSLRGELLQCASH